MNCYYKNFILCSPLEQYCLLCNEIFYLIPDIEKHIRWEKHRKLLKTQSLLPKLKKEFIYKIENDYYCERCNYVAPSVASITEHTKTEKHALLKKNPRAELKRPYGIADGDYVLINKVIIHKHQWNSIRNDKCLICDIEFTNENDIEEHIKTREHLIKLIHSETKYADNQYYRKINEETFHCFSCKDIFTANNFANHWTNCRQDNKEYGEYEKSESGKHAGATTKTICKMQKLESRLVATLDDFYVIDEENNISICRSCNEHIPISFSTMLTHMKQDHMKPIVISSSESSDSSVEYREISDNGEKRAKLKNYGQTHCIKLNYNGGKGYCMLCDKYLSASKPLFRRHVHGAIHRGHLELQGLKKEKVREKLDIAKQTIKLYLANLQGLPAMLSFWMKGELPVDVHSFFFIYAIPKDPHYKKTKCYACTAIFPSGYEREHCLTSNHMETFFAAEVLAITDEFIRELRPNVYHCGFCNTILPFAETLEKHFKCSKHIKIKFEKATKRNIPIFWRNFNPAALDISGGDEQLYLDLLEHVYG